LLDDDAVEITELPPQVWTENYRDKLDKMRGGTDDKGKKMPTLIDSFDDMSSDSRVKFVVKLTPAQLKNAQNQGYHEYFGLIKTITYTNTMVLFDEFGKLQVYKSTTDIAKER